MRTFAGTHGESKLAGDAVPIVRLKCETAGNWHSHPSVYNVLQLLSPVFVERAVRHIGSEINYVTVPLNPDSHTSVK